MEEKSSREYIKRTQKDYSMSFKLSVVQEIERGEIGIKGVHRKYGIQGDHTVTVWLRKDVPFDWENQTTLNIPKTQEQKLLELEQKVKLLEKQKAFLENQLETLDKKAILFDIMIELAEKEYGIPIRRTP